MTHSPRDSGHVNASEVLRRTMADVITIVLVGGSLFAGVFGLWRLALAVALVLREFRDRR